MVDLERRLRRRVEYYGFPPLKDHIDDLHLEIQRVVERAYIENRDDDFLARFWEMGADGVYSLTRPKEARSRSRVVRLHALAEPPEQVPQGRCEAQSHAGEASLARGRQLV